MVKSVKRLVVAILCALLVSPAVARADGNPAGDVLVTQTVFYGSALDLKSKPAAQLPALLERANAEGYELRVAALTVPADLGAVDYLWEDPLNYVDLLANELSYRYRGRTLVSMPSGYAIYWPGHSVTREQRVLDGLEPPGDADPAVALPRLLAAVVALAAARDIALSVPDVSPPPGGVTQPESHFTERANAPAPGPAPVSGESSWMFAIPVVALVLLASVLISRQRLRERRTA